MNKFRFTINALAIAIFTFAFASMAQAQATRTWVSGVGDDANPCSRTAPCKTFAGAVSTNLVLRNVTIKNNSVNGILTATTGTASTSIDFEQVNVSNSVNGFNAQNGTRGSMRACVFGLNSTSGITTSQSTSGTEVNVDASLFSGSATGINTGASTHVRIARCLISQNANALGLSGLVDSGGNNTIMGNSSNQDPNGQTFIQK